MSRLDLAAAPAWRSQDEMSQASCQGLRYVHFHV